MNSVAAPAGLVWASRGRSWGFRFLLSGGLDDPLHVYEQLLGGRDDGSELLVRGSGKIAFRFADPENRHDASGRVIPHEFVLWNDLVHRITSVDEARQAVWPLVAEAYSAIWAEPMPPHGDVKLVGLHS